MTPEENGGHHLVEDAVVVYLKYDFDADDWIVDRAAVDGGALFSQFSDYKGVEAPLTEECVCDDPTACEQARLHAARTSLPTGEELMHRIRDAVEAEGRA
ncbi:hypothetical protein FB384_004906 [Prauserella sediminis]|uniref:Uncharacterized protein n=1 Tax=Prauserella sediminis TaxID=577680 RepID=A0A839XT91_9PSEU|nr:hypothetical protein [Prauserella sediminis]MBB3665947.1 hypothetical protein [Prauserella sediminis]